VQFSITILILSNDTAKTGAKMKDEDEGFKIPIEGTEEYYVEKVLDKRVFQGKVSFLLILSFLCFDNLQLTTS
jgi:hypothetical protein